MKTAKVTYKTIKNNDSILKPNYHLNYGKNRVENAIENSFPFTNLGTITDKVFTGGIFKRVFVEDLEYGKPYISAQHMMNMNPLDVAKIISKKYTPRQDDMSLKENQILISCAGTVGNAKLITKDLVGVIGSQDIIRVDPDNSKMLYGYLYAYLSSSTAYNYIQSYIYGSVVPRITPDTLIRLPIPLLSEQKQKEIHQLIVEASELRVEANKLLEEAEKMLKNKTGLKDLSPEEYEYFGVYDYKRRISAFKINSGEINPISINAFNYSKKIRSIIQRVKKNKYLTLKECIEEGNFFSTGSFKRVETNSSKSIKLINQSDIFNFKKQGKILSRRIVGDVKLAEYGEVLIAGVGTLGENETFCRTIFVNEELQNELIAGEFIRMKVNNTIPSGYLFCWLNSDYGFRLIRSTQSGTKLCRPIQELLKEIPVPIIDFKEMDKIDRLIKKAHTNYFESINKENLAISLIEKEIDTWQQS